MNSKYTLISTKVPLVKRDPYLLELRPRNKKRTSSNFTYHVDFIDNKSEKSIFIRSEYKKLYLDYRKKRNLFDYKNSLSDYYNRLKYPNLMHIKKRNFSTESELSSSENLLPIKEDNNNNKPTNNYDTYETMNKKQKNNNTYQTQEDLPPIRPLNKCSSAISLTKGEKLRLIKLKSGIKMTKFFGQTLLSSGEYYNQNKTHSLIGASATKNIKNLINLINTNNDAPSTTKQKLKFSKNELILKYNLRSKILGKVSVFGIISGVGEFGHLVAKLVKNFLVEYIQNSSEIQICPQRDNYYSIFYKMFEKLTNFLKLKCKGLSDNPKDNLNKLDLNIYKNGATCILLFFPDERDFSHKCYCVNIGNSKAILYSDLTKPTPLSYAHIPNCASERERILSNGGLINKKLNENGNTNTKMDPDNFYECVYKITKSVEDKDYSLLTRVIGNFEFESAGVIWEPEIIECSLNKDEPRFIILGTDSFWKYVSHDEARDIVMKTINTNNEGLSCKDLIDCAKLSWRKHGCDYEDISVIIVYFAWEKYRI